MDALIHTAESNKINNYQRYYNYQVNYRKTHREQLRKKSLAYYHNHRLDRIRYMREYRLRKKQLELEALKGISGMTEFDFGSRNRAQASSIDDKISLQEASL